MEVLLASDTLKVFYDEKNELLKQVWFTSMQTYTEDDYKRDMIILLDIVHKVKNKLSYVNTQQSTFVISPELQEWTNINIIKPTLQYGLKKVGFLVSSDLFAQISIQQTMEEEKDSGFETRYFNKEEECIKWLLIP